MGFTFDFDFNDLIKRLPRVNLPSSAANVWHSVHHVGLSPQLTGIQRITSNLRLAVDHETPGDRIFSKDRDPGGAGGSSGGEGDHGPDGVGGDGDDTGGAHGTDSAGTGEPSSPGEDAGSNPYGEAASQGRQQGSDKLESSPTGRPERGATPSDPGRYSLEMKITRQALPPDAPRRPSVDNPHQTAGRDAGLHEPRENSPLPGAEKSPTPRAEKAAAPKVEKRAVPGPIPLERVEKAIVSASSPAGGPSDGSSPA